MFRFGKKKHKDENNTQSEQKAPVQEEIPDYEARINKKFAEKQSGLKGFYKSSNYSLEQIQEQKYCQMQYDPYGQK